MIGSLSFPTDQALTRAEHRLHLRHRHMAHIVLPTDFSDTSFKAAMFAFDLFGTDGNTFTLVHTYLKPAFDNALLPPIGDSTRRKAVNGLRRFEHGCRAHAGKAVLAKKASHLQLTDVLNALDQEKGIDMIVMGTQGEGNHGLVGRNTTAVVLGATAPVIAVPSQWSPVPVARIMLAHDGGSLDRFTPKPLIDLVKRTGAEVVLAHVRDTSMASDKRTDRTQANELFTDIAHSFVTVHATEVVKTIDELAQQGRIQLVAVIHRQLGSWEGLFHSSKAAQMALHTTVPMLVLPERP